MGFRQGRTPACCFDRPGWKIKMVAHGDDLAALGTRDNLDLYEAVLREAFDVKIRGVFWMALTIPKR